MIHVVTAASAERYSRQLAQMHQQRRQVFVERLGWKIPVQADGREIDEFDTAAATYLLALDEAGRCRGSLRLLPTEGPHLLGDLFPELCARPAPRERGILEISRFCTDPDLPDPRLVRKRLLVALVEYALLYEVTSYTCVTHADALSQLVAIGWDCARLGELRRDEGCEIGALQIRITAQTLSLLRDRAGFRAPVLRLEVCDAA